MTTASTTRDIRTRCAVRTSTTPTPSPVRGKARDQRRLALRPATSALTSDRRHYTWCERASCRIDKVDSTHFGPRSDITVAGTRIGTRMVCDEQGGRVGSGERDFYVEIDVEDLESLGEGGHISRTNTWLSEEDLREVMGVLTRNLDRLEQLNVDSARASSTGPAQLIDVVRAISHLSIREADLNDGCHAALEYDPEHTTIFLNRSHSDKQLADELARVLPDVLVAEHEHAAAMRQALIDDGVGPVEEEHDDLPSTAHPGWCVRDCRSVPETGELEHESDVIATVSLPDVPGSRAPQQRWRLSLVRSDLVKLDGDVVAGTEYVEGRLEECAGEDRWVPARATDGGDAATLFQSLEEADRWVAGLQAVRAAAQV